MVLAILLGIGLAASAGLNAFVPLLLLSAAAHFHLAGIALNAKFAWLASDTALAVLLVATLIELIVDKIPAADHALHAIGFVIRPLAGIVAAASVMRDVDPMVAGIAAIIIGAPTSLAFHAAKSSTRVISSATTLGCANPILSVVEDFVSFSFAVISLLVPLLVPLLMIAAVVLFVALFRRKAIA
jgi:uncharacterized membrane protein